MTILTSSADAFTDFILLHEPTLISAITLPLLGNRLFSSFTKELRGLDFHLCNKDNLSHFVEHVQKR